MEVAQGLKERCNAVERKVRELHAKTECKSFLKRLTRWLNAGGWREELEPLLNGFGLQCSLLLNLAETLLMIGTNKET